MPDRNFRAVLNELSESARSPAEKGALFERLVKAFLERDKQRQAQFAHVWPWRDYPHNRGMHDIGIDLVAEERDTGNHVAIQCKFYGPGTQVSRDDVNKLLGAYATPQYAYGIIVSTSDHWTGNAEKALLGLEKPVQRWNADVFEQSTINWQDFDLDTPDNLADRATKSLRDYQQAALDDVLNGFDRADRGKLIMACGSGKTFTALRIAESVAAAGGTVLFLTPSISLLSQSLIDWANDADRPLKTFAVCSDIRAGRRSDSDEDLSPYDLTETPSTNPEHLTARFRAARRNSTMTVIFSTYQSLNVISEAQQMENGLPEFDLVICDEAHRTTGARLAGQDESNFQRVHDNHFIAARKRLYMTATPRIYGDRAKRKANENRLTLASMDDESVYGPEFHRLGFGQATELGILTPYKVVILNVDQQQVGIDLDALLSSSAEVNMDSGARMVGCWNGLGKRGAAGVDFTADPLPAKRAVAFSNTIKQSQNFAQHFNTVIESCINAGGDHAANQLRCIVHHVDGKQTALHRADRLAWLRQEPPADVCQILSNARCLTEGIDVPALDAVLFLHPRKSDIDVVQAVGRVMRKSPGKQFGYIILPIAQAPNATPQETVSSSAYKAVWQVINAISAHDDRFEALINQLALTAEKPADPGGNGPDGVDIGTGNGDPGDAPDPDGIQGRLLIQAAPELRDAILAKIVAKYADPGYWEKWAASVREIAQRHEARIRALLNNPQSGVRPIFDHFLAGLRRNLNDGITDNDAIGMLSQHLISKPVFDALFADYAFAAENPVSRAMQAMLECLHDRGLEKETEGLEGFYRDVRISVQGITDAASKQKIIAQLYQRFFKLALPETAARLGIVYTPVEVVDYILRSVEDVLNREFGASVSDQGVHVLDPFVGTGTFITRLLRSGLIRPDDLPRKYESELHANDIMLLAYYVAAVNIESTYHDLTAASQYRPFNGIVLTDTFQSYEPDAPLDESLFPRNSRRIRQQRGLDIRVIISNPPWSATNNRAYPTIDRRVQQTYAAPSATSHLSALYDPYVKAIRLASDRIQGSESGGIVGFVTNGGFIDSNAFDGFRKAVAGEFHAIYCYNLRGDARTSGDKRQREGGGIFDVGSRAGVGIMLLVKKPGKSPGAAIHYRDIGDYLRREDKLRLLGHSRLAETQWQPITPNEHGDWINQRSDAFLAMRPLAAANGDANGPAPIFNRRTLGLVTSRDAWCFNASAPKLRENIARTVNYYNERMAAFQETKPAGTLSERIAAAKAFINGDSPHFHWDAKNYRDLVNGETYDVNDGGFTVASYRPFARQHLYFDRRLNNSIRDFPQIYPTRDADNLGIYLTGPGSSVPFTALMTDCIADAGLTSGNGSSPYIPRYRYVPAQTLTRPPDPANPELERVSNINPAALAQFREHYGDDAISEDDLFYYAYGALHSPQWRQKFADDLSKAAARIPMAATADDFRTFAAAGRELADLHVNYETVDPYPLLESYGPGWRPDAPNAYRIEKMSYAGPARSPNKTAIICNAQITLSGIPPEAHEYRLGSRSALDWLLERYRITTDAKSGITNNPNDWPAEHANPRYIIDLVKRITTVSVRTVEIVRHLPYLRFDAAAPPPDAGRFHQLADQWERDTAYLSNFRQMASHPAYQEIIGMGDALVPLILERLEQRGGRWYSALRTITAADPILPKDRGNVPAMTAAWLEWGQRNGYA